MLHTRVSCYLEHCTTTLKPFAMLFWRVVPNNTAQTEVCSFQTSCQTETVGTCSFGARVLAPGSDSGIWVCVRHKLAYADEKGKGHKNPQLKQHNMSSLNTCSTGPSSLCSFTSGMEGKTNHSQSTLRHFNLVNIYALPLC